MNKLFLLLLVILTFADCKEDKNIEKADNKEVNKVIDNRSVKEILNILTKSIWIRALNKNQEYIATIIIKQNGIIEGQFEGSGYLVKIDKLIINDN